MRTDFLPYARPDITQHEIASVVESLENGWLTTGPRTAAFEEAFVRASGVRHAVALNSCTAALHLALIALGIGEGDEVITPSFSFVAGAQCIREVGAKPVFCDIDAETFSISEATVAPSISERTKAIVALPYAGRPLGMERLCAFASTRGIAVIEDAAHAVGMLDGGRWAGTHSTAAAFSFYATKNVTTAEGGMLLTNDDRLAERVRRLSLHGMSRDAWRRYQKHGTWRYDVLEPGFKYNMPDLAAAIGLAQLSRLDAMQHRRDAIALCYREAFERLPGISPQREPDAGGDRHAHCMFAALIEPAIAGIDRDGLLDALREANIGTSVHYIPTHLLSAYRKLAATPLPNTERVGERIFSLPLYPSMSDADVADVIEALGAILGARVPA